MKPLRILIIGSGGREHALAWKLASSPHVGKIFSAPGNAGTASLGENIPIAATDIDRLLDFAKTQSIDLTIVGPDDPLAAGICDLFRETGLRIFGPSAAAARLESSKSFAKSFMQRHGIPTASSAVFGNSLEAHDYCRGAKYPLVIKADGLALGKGVVIASNPLEAAIAIHRSMEIGVFGEAGRRVVIEEFLTGPECSIHALVDASGYCLFPDARDHKRALEGNLGPNTGGMGTISPSGVLNESLWQTIREDIMDRFVEGLKADNLSFQGMLFPGLILTPDGPKVLEFNCRFGDPETQVLLRRLKSDLLDLLLACTEDRVASETPTWSDDVATCVVLASAGYPGPITKGKTIGGLETTSPPGVVFHAGTRRVGEDILTDGGRVLGVTAIAPTLEASRQAAYREVSKITFDGMQFRRDIGA
ncbi:MAG: phosphoribosylamine--glycine ligase [Terrimicrobiaceae bacterium]